MVGRENLFWRALANRKLVFCSVELVEQSRRKICEDVRVLAMMCIGKMAGCVVLPRFSRLTGKCGDTVCA